MDGRTRFLIGVSTTAMAVALTLCWAGIRGMAYAAEHNPADRPATHNMLMVGEETVYLSHLPMFQTANMPRMPHRYQTILEVTFAQQEEYVKDRQEHRSTNIYTLTPEDFVLPELVSSDPQHKPRGAFNANTIFRGHLERSNSAPILHEVEISVNRVVYFREFDPKAQKSPQLEYLLFGTGQNLFMAHVIIAPPDFDQVLAVKVTDHAFTNEELTQGVRLVFPGTTNAPTSRLREKQQLAAEMHAENAPAPKTIQVEVTRELYFEEGELRVPAVFETTSMEQEAGFL